MVWACNEEETEALRTIMKTLKERGRKRPKWMETIENDMRAVNV